MSSKSVVDQSSNETISGTDGDDPLVGQAGSDRFLGSFGNDTLKGGPSDDTGNDTIDYSKLGQGITLIPVLPGRNLPSFEITERPSRVLKGDRGEDQIEAIETLIASSNQTNRIDLTASAPITRVDLEAGRVSVVDPFFGPSTLSTAFSIQGFNEVLGGGSRSHTAVGSNRNDVLIAGSGDNTLEGRGGDDVLDLRGTKPRTFSSAKGEAGNDLIFADNVNDDLLDGGPGRDTVSYEGSDNAQLKYRLRFAGDSPGINTVANRVEGSLFVGSGILGRGARGGDSLISIERVIGSDNRAANSIDFSASLFPSDQVFRPDLGIFPRPLSDPPPSGFAPAITADLGEGRLIFENTFLEVQNFSKVTGSFGNDFLSGSGGDDELNGYFGRDNLTGKGGNDLLVTDEQDWLTGGGGSDRFMFVAAAMAEVGPDGTRFRELSSSYVVDFEPGVDQLLFENDAQLSIRRSDTATTETIPFSGLADGAVAESQFAVVGQDEVTDQTRFVYNRNTGELFVRGVSAPASLNPSGADTGLPEQLKVATLFGAPSLQASDLLIV